MYKKLTNIFPALLACLIFIGCAPSTQFIPIPKGSGPAPSNPNLARIYIMRTSGAVGAAGVAWDFKEGSKYLGYVGPNGHLVWERPPGEVSIVWPCLEGTLRPLKFDAKAGKTYYVKVANGFSDHNPTKGQTTFLMLDEQEGMRTLRECPKGPRSGN